MTLEGLLSPATIDSMAKAFIDGGRVMEGRTAAVANSLVASLLTLQMSWFGVQALLESVAGDNLGDVLARLLRFILLFGLVSWLLTSYDFVFYQSLYGGCTAVVDAIAGTGGELQAFATAWSVLLDLMLSVWHSLEATPAHFLAGTTPLDGGFYKALFALVLTWCALLGCFWGFVRCLVMVAIVQVLGSALVGLALALGPFFIPWLLCNPTRQLFEGWLRFLVTASFYRVVAITVLQLAKPIFQQIQLWLANGSDPTQATSPFELMMASVMLIVVAQVLGDLLTRVPQLTAALLGHGRVDVGQIGTATRAADRGFQRLTGARRAFGRNED